MFWHSLILILPLTLAAELQLSLPSNLPTLPPSTHALLSQPSTAPISAPITTSNGFLFRNLTAGSYDLHIACRDYDFERDVTVEVLESGKVEVFRVGNYGMGAKTSIVAGEDNGIELRVLRRREFYEEREGFSPLSLLKNPMILIAVLGLAFVLGMPYLLENMDPEMRAEFEEQQKKSILSGGASAQNPLQNFDMAAWMAGKTAGSGGGETSGRETEAQAGGGRRRRG